MQCDQLERPATAIVDDGQALWGSRMAHWSESFREVLEAAGEHPDRQGLQRTPLRVARALEFLTSGYRTDLTTVLNDAVFEVDYDDLVVVRDVEIFSLCEHHLLPFFGSATVAYVPNGKVIGISKIPRIIDLFARRLQLQERLTQEIAGAIEAAILPRGVSVKITARHCCLMMRGVRKQNATMVTRAARGRLDRDGSGGRVDPRIDSREHLTRRMK